MKNINKRAAVAIINCCLLICSTLMNVGCTTEELGAGLGVVFGPSGEPINAECEAELYLPEVKWYSSNIDGPRTIIDEVDGILLVFESETRNLVGMDKRDGQILWRNSNLNLPHGDFLKSYSLENEMLLYWDKQGIRLDVNSGELLERFEAEFSFLSLAYQNDFYYAYSNPHDDNRPFGLYRRAVGSQEGFVMYHLLNGIDYRTAALLPMLITKSSLGNEIMVLAINYTTQSFEKKSQLTAIDLTSDQLLWEDVRDGNEQELEEIKPHLTAKSSLIICRNDFIESIDVDDGTQRWEAYVSNQRFSSAKLFIDGNKAFVNGPYDGFHGCFDLYDGRLVWTYDSYQKSPVFFINWKMIWDDTESKNLRFVDVANGLPGDLLPQPWQDCSAKSITYLENKKHNDPIIVAFTNDNIVGLEY